MPNPEETDMAMAMTLAVAARSEIRTGSEARENAASFAVS
jgi:hypothetical protein